MFDLKITGLDKVQKTLKELPRRAKFNIDCPSCSNSLGQFNLEELERSNKIYCKNCDKNVQIKLEKK
jgi:transcription elongation factor Elf1